MGERSVVTWHASASKSQEAHSRQTRHWNRGTFEKLPTWENYLMEVIYSDSAA